MKEIQLIDNFLEFNTFKEIQQNLLSCTWPWYYQDRVDFNYEEDEHNKDLTDFQFCYAFYRNSAPVNSGFSLISPITDKLNALSFVRIKANLQPRTEIQRKNKLHHDVSSPDGLRSVKHVMTAIYYVNSNDGYTFFEGGQKIESVENRLIKFPSHLKHGGTTCTDQKVRVLINFNYVPIDYWEE